MSRPDDDGGFDILSFSLERDTDRGPLQMISGERFARLQAIEAAAVRYVGNATPDNFSHLVGVVRSKTSNREQS